MNHWVWSETLPWDELGAPRTLALLRRFDLGVLAALRPGDVPGDALERLRDAGVPVGLWPMLSDAEGRWGSLETLEAYLGWTRTAAAHGPARLAFDLEPSFARMAPLLRGDVRAALRPAAGLSFEAARARLAADLHLHASAGVPALAAVLPPLVLGDRWQARLGTPVEAGFDHLSVMAYTSLLEGWSAGLLRREDARGLLGALAVAARARWGARAGMSVGAVGVGAFGSEPQLRSPEELADDVAICKAAGITTICLLDLGGVLRRPPAEAWLEALQAPAHAEVPAPTLRVRGLLKLLRTL